MMDRKGIVFTRPRDTISFFMGVFIAAFGLLPLLTKMGMMSLPAFMTNIKFEIAIWIIAVAGLYVVIDGFIEPPAHSLHWFLIGAGILLFIIGLLPILSNYKVIGMSFGFLNNLYIYQAVITIEGVLLMIGGLTEH
jgi:hypothetical protein